MMDDETGWQDAAIAADSPMIGPTRPEADDELATGIASIFAALQARGEDEEVAEGPDEFLEDEHTFQLLGELDRLWLRQGP